MFYSRGASLPPFMAYPRFLLECELSETAKLVYIILLDRAKLSGKNDGWTDEQGRVFLYYTIHGLAEAIHRSDMTVKTALAALERSDLITRKRQGIGRPNRIYVKLPVAQSLSERQTESLPLQGQVSVHPQESQLSTNQMIEHKQTYTKEDIYIERIAYGSYRNVLLSAEERRILSNEVANLDVLIEKLSCYIASTGKRYQSHAAALRSWALRDKPPKSNRHYECEESESL